MQTLCQTKVSVAGSVDRTDECCCCLIWTTRSSQVFWGQVMICKLCLCTVSLFGQIIVVKSANDPSSTTVSHTNTIDHADNTEVYPASVVNCSFAENLCWYRQGCVDTDMEVWKANNSNANVRQFSTLHGGNVYSVLESPWVNFSTPSCVQFTYNRGTPYQLKVFLALNNGTWSLKHDSFGETNFENHTSRFDIEYFAGKIQFRAQGGGAGGDVAPLKIYYVIILEGPCGNHGKTTSTPQHGPPTAVKPSRVQPEVSDPTSCEMAPKPPLTTEHTTPGDTTLVSCTSTDAPTTSQKPATGGSSTFSSSSQQSSTGTGFVSSSGGSGNDVVVIAGVSVAAIAAVVVFVIMFLVYRRKFRSRKPDGRKSSVEGMSTSARDGDYPDIDAVGSLTQATAGNADFNPDDPYELAKDGAPGKTRNSLTDPFTNGASHHNHHHHQLNGTLEDDYSCIDDTQPTAGKNTTPATPDPRDVYSVVNKPGKKTPTPVYSLAKIVGDKPVLPNPNDGYSVVNKNGKNPTPAPKPGHSDTEYNTISHTGNNATEDKVARGATSDPYNRIGAVASLGTDGQNRESTIAEEGSLVDDYNTLDFADTLQNEPRKEKNGAARAAYDHVHNDPDDTYNKTRIGKRNVVIGSDYDHVKPSN